MGLIPVVLRRGSLHRLEMGRLRRRADVGLVRLIRLLNVRGRLRVLRVVHGADGDGRLVVLVLVLEVRGWRRARDLVVPENWRRGRGVCERCGWLEVAGGVVGCRRLRGPAGGWAGHVVVVAEGAMGGSCDVRDPTRGRVRWRPGDGSRLDGGDWRRGRCWLRRW